MVQRYHKNTRLKRFFWRFMDRFWARTGGRIYKMSRLVMTLCLAFVTNATAMVVSAVVLDYPFLYPLTDDFWPDFWKFYQAQREANPRSGGLASAAIGNE